MSWSELFAKYDVPIPRYTSYPTVPQWRVTPTLEQWIASLSSAIDGPDASLALYVHVPFCESLCTFCGCNTVITRDHTRESPYIDLILAELDAYLRAVPQLANVPVRQLHLGGGTPTFLSADSLATLVDGVTARLPKRSGIFEASVEVDPRVTNAGQLEVLATRGFRRVSLGVQDLDLGVQKLVNRVQPLALTETLCVAARHLGYESINFDLIYGLPGQTRESMVRLSEAVLGLDPNRLAVYSFARVPWIKPAQRKFKDDQVPVGAEKRALYETIRGPLLVAGYVELGLDHFARPDDSLARAAAAGRMHRNFMGYTDVHTSALIGLGVSGISETADCYHQNEKVITTYERRVRDHEIPTLRGHVLSPEDRRRKRKIEELMTSFEVGLDQNEAATVLEVLGPMLDDRLVYLDGERLVVPTEGRPFVRNAATFFDEYLGREPNSGPIYSTSA